MSGGSKSKTSSSSSFSNEDRRVVADGGSLGLSAENVLGAGMQSGITGSKNRVNLTDASTDNSVTTLNLLDGGAIKESADVVRAALRTVEVGDATNGEGFSRLLDFAGRLFDGAGDVISRSQSMAESAQAGALATASEMKTGSIDNKTIVVIAVAGAAAVAAWGMNRK